MSKILVTGATGHLGKEVVYRLLEKNEAANISVLARKPSKAEELKEKGVSVVMGDYDDYNSLLAAFKGVDKLYFVSGSDIMKRLIQHENVVKAAAEAGVGHIFYTSFQRKTEDGSSPVAMIADVHLQTEQWIRESGLTYTILNHALYFEAVANFIGKHVLDTQMIYLPAGEGKSSYASRKDLAAAGALVLAGHGHENKAYEFSGNTSWSFYDIAGMLTELSGKSVKYLAPSVQEYSEKMSGAGMPPEAIQAVSAFSQGIAQGEFDVPDSTLEKLLGRKPESLKEFLKKAYNL